MSRRAARIESSGRIIMSAAVSYLLATLLGSALLVAAVVTVGATGHGSSPSLAPADAIAAPAMQPAYVTVGFLGRRAVRR
jgi:hypothetical protein